MLRVVVHLPRRAFPDGVLDDDTRQELEDVLSASLLDDTTACAVPRMSVPELDAVAPYVRCNSKVIATCKDDATCTICLDTFTNRTRRFVRQLPCNHVFCSKCITKWTTKESASCPTCREQLA